MDTGNSSSGSSRYNVNRGSYNYNGIWAGYDVSTGAFKWIFGIIAAAIGLPLCFLGNPWWKFWALPIGVLVGVCGFHLIESNLIVANGANTSETWYHIVMLAGYALMGCVGFFVYYKFKKFAVAITCAAIGCGGGMMLAAMINSMLSSGVMAGWCQLLIIIACGCAGFFLGCKWEDQMTIWGLSGIGATLFVGGLGTIFELYPYPHDTSNSNKTWEWWVFFACNILFWVLGLLYQCNIYKKKGSGLRHGDNVQVEVTYEVK